MIRGPPRSTRPDTRFPSPPLSRSARSTGATEPLVSADWSVDFVTYSDSGRYRVWGTNADARTAVAILDTQTGEEIELASLPPGDLAQVRFSRDESRLALILSSDTPTPDVYTVHPPAGDRNRPPPAFNPPDHARH